MTLAERGLSSIQYGSIKTFLSLWDVSGQGEIRTYCLLGVLGHFGLSIKFLYVNCPGISQYIYYPQTELKRFGVETF